VGNHTWRHRNAWFLSPAAVDREITVGARILQEIVGQSPRLYRPPWGIVNVAALATARRLGLVTALWSIQPEGLRRRPPAAQLRHVADRLHDGAIIDLHDAPGLPGAPERVLAMLPDLLDVLEGRGYSAVPIGQLLAPPAKILGPPPVRAVG
jgi:peptidoglycan/xylan/chitin deacetylase (PgdA/CDA1 family)